MRAVGLLFSSLFIAAFPSLAQTSPDLVPSWIGTWGVSPAPQLSAEDQVRKAGLLFENQTVREIVHVSAGGSQVRLRISNAYGKQSVHIAGVHVAVVQKDAAIVPGTDRAVTFSGRASVVVPPDALLLSDPVSRDSALIVPMISITEFPGFP